MGIRVAEQYVQTRNLVHHTQQPGELLEAAHGSPGQCEASELGVKLEGGGGERGGVIKAEKQVPFPPQEAEGANEGRERTAAKAA